MKTRMKKPILNLLLAACAVFTLSPRRLVQADPTNASSVAGIKFVPTDEFAGPFASWLDVKRDFGAKGDGVTDDSDAINRALADLRQSKRAHSVLYFPSGTYRITQTITDSPCTTFHEGIGISVIGADPANTVIKWDGPEKGTVFSYTAWYSRISRLTLDGSGTAGIGLLYNAEKFSTYNETSDLVFKNCDVGLQMGGLGGDMGQAENMVLRCRFLDCASGLRTKSFNSLDIWVWDSLFADCGEGIRNVAGNFNVYSSVFLRSKTYDLTSQNLESFSFIDNVSVGSGMFLDFSNVPAGVYGQSPLSISGNRVYDWTGNQGAIKLGGGPALVWGNTFRNRPGDQGPAIILGGDQGLFGNTYCVPVPAALPHPSRYRELTYQPRTLSGEGSIVDRSAIPDPELVLPDFPPHVERKVFEVEPGAGAAGIQAAIDAAAALKTGQRPVVHLPQGVYAIDTTLVVAAGTDLQLIGDGTGESATELNWTGAKGAFLLRFEEPSQASINQMYVQNHTGDGLDFENCDGTGGRFYADRLNAGAAGSGAAVLVNGMDQSDVQFRCLALNSGSFRVRGGQDAQAGHPVKGVTAVLCCTPDAAKQAVFDVESGATAILRTLYYDAGHAVPIVAMSGSGNLFIDSGVCVATSKPDVPTFDFANFSGTGLITDYNPMEGAGHQGLVTKLEGDCSKATVLNFGSEIGTTSAHDLGDLLINVSAPPCRDAGIYTAVLKNSALPWPQTMSHPDDIPVLDPARAAHPGEDLAHALDIFAASAKPHTPGLGDNERPRIHSVMVWVGGDTGVLINGTEGGR